MNDAARNAKPTTRPTSKTSIRLPQRARRAAGAAGIWVDVVNVADSGIERTPGFLRGARDDCRSYGFQGAMVRNDLTICRRSRVPTGARVPTRAGHFLRRT